MTGIRYGVFLRPDAATCWNVIQITSALRSQFGLVSAGAFPPHVTLAGNVATTAGVDELEAALDPVLAAVPVFPVCNAGVVGSVGYVYDVDGDGTGRARNGPLAAVAARVRDALLPLSTATDDFLVTPLERSRFVGHIGLASHELHIDDHLQVEVGEFIGALPVEPPPARFDARWYSLLRFESDWSGRWWETMTWEHVRSWRAN